jgi:hypothetical protein
LENSASTFHGPQQLSKRDFSFSPDNEIDAGISRVSFGSKAGIVSTDNELHLGTQRANEFYDAQRGSSLEGHGGKTNDIRLVLKNETFNRLSDGALCQDQIRYRYPVMSIDVSGK